MARLLDAVEVASRATGGLVDGDAGARDRGRRLPRRPRRAAPAARSRWRSRRRGGPRRRARGRDPVCACRASTAAIRPAGRAPPAGRRDRQRRARQGPVRRPDRRADARQLRRRLRRRPALRRRAAPDRGRRSVRRPAAARLRGARRRRRRRAGSAARSWLDARGRPAHHLLDPATGRPAFTGVVQATALAPTALEAEWRAKAAVLSADAGTGSPTAACSCTTTEPQPGGTHDQTQSRHARCDGRDRVSGDRLLGSTDSTSTPREPQQQHSSSRRRPRPT